MKVFLLGATGYIGNVVAERLQKKGHDVLGLARSPEAVEELRAQGIKPHGGDLRDPASLAEGARQADATANLAQPAFDLQGDFAQQMVALGRTVKEAVGAILEATHGTGKPLLFTGGTGAYGDTGAQVATEETPVAPLPFMQSLAEAEQSVLGGKGVRGMVLRPGIVYGRGGGPVAFAVEAARRAGGVRVVGEGRNELSFVHVEDLADLYLLMLERGGVGTLLNGVAEPFVTQLELMRAVSRAAGYGGEVQIMPAEGAGAQLQNIFSRTMRVSGARARQLGWNPTRPSVLTVLQQDDASHAPRVA